MGHGMRLLGFRSCGLAFGLLIGLAAGPARAAVETPDITVGYIPSITAVASYVARDHGFFQQAGLRVKLVAIDQGSTAVAGIVSDSLQISTSLPTNFIQAYANGVDVVVIANSHIYPTPNEVDVLVRTGGDITTLAGLVGRRVAVNGLQGVQHLLLLHALQVASIDPAQVRFIEVGFPQMADALKSGQVDAATISEPYLQRIVASQIGRRLIDLQSDIPAGTMGTVYIATRDWVAANPGTVQAFRTALSQAVQAIHDNPQIATDSVMTALHVDPAVAALLHVPNLATAAAPQQMRFWADLMWQEHVLTGPVDVARMVAP
jgi:NitT/TauT family transport system substrate-binding protein